MVIGGESMVSSLTGMTRREINRVVERYEWFTAARRARALLTGEPDPALTLPLLFWQTATTCEAIEPEGGLCEPSTSTEPNHETLIDRFIEFGAGRISPESAVAEVSVEIDIDPDMVSPELAAIYRAQGLTSEAEKIEKILKDPKR